MNDPRTTQRAGTVHHNYEGVSWKHDAAGEMWCVVCLQGIVQSRRASDAPRYRNWCGCNPGMYDLNCPVHGADVRTP